MPLSSTLMQVEVLSLLNLLVLGRAWLCWKREEGYNNEANFTLQEAQAMPELYLKRRTLTSKDLSIIVLAGSILGEARQ